MLLLVFDCSVCGFVWLLELCLFVFYWCFTLVLFVLSVGGCFYCLILFKLLGWFNVCCN